jgi:hypothetical protein
VTRFQSPKSMARCVAGRRVYSFAVPERNRRGKELCTQQAEGQSESMFLDKSAASKVQMTDS